MRSANCKRSSFNCSGVKVPTTPRKFPSKVSLATREISERSRSKKRSIAFPTIARSLEILTLAIA